MPTVQYEMTYSRTIDVEVTEEELQALRDSSAGAYDIQQSVIDRAIEAIPKKADGCDMEPEWIMSNCTYEPEEGGLEELFDL